VESHKNYTRMGIHKLYTPIAYFITAINYTRKNDLTYLTIAKIYTSKVFTKLVL
jgi:hypothetical protein